MNTGTDEAPLRQTFPAWTVLLAACVETGLNDPDETVVEAVIVEERFIQTPAAGVDVLLVIDSTGSMAEEQTQLSGAVSALVAGLGGIGLDWQIGVASMDLAQSGALVGRPWIVTPATPDAEGVLAASVLVGTASPPPAAGLDAAVLALTSPANIGFRRSGTALHVVFVSDGDDGSGAVLGDDPVVSFLGVLDEQVERSGRTANASALVDDSSGACDAPEFDALPGYTFVETAERSGGVVASICGGDFGGVVSALAAVGAVGATVFPLQETPSSEALAVSVDGARMSSGWAVDYDAPALVFSAPPALGAEILVRYAIAE